MTAAGNNLLPAPAGLAALLVQLLVGDTDHTAGLPCARLELLPDTGHPLERVNLVPLAGRVRAFALAR